MARLENGLMNLALPAAILQVGICVVSLTLFQSCLVAYLPPPPFISSWTTLSRDRSPL